MPAYGYVIIVVTWVAWFTPFFLVRNKGTAPAKLDRRARWGILLQFIAYSLLWQNSFWARPLAVWRIALAIPLLIGASIISWNAAQTLGRQFRMDAGINPDHELVRSGVYRAVRHPIYTSMLCLLLGTGFMVTPPLLMAAAIVVFIAGTEIRVRIEDGLLASQFGDEFRAYQRTVRAYVPFLR